MAEIKILSVNCQGLGSSEKRTDVFNYIKSKHCHIYCLQDVHSTQDNEKFIRTQWGSHCLFSSGKSNSRGVAILFSKNLDFKLHGHISDKEGNFLLVDLSVENNRFTLITLYGPNIDSPPFFRNIIAQAETFNNDNFIICGDFNLVQDTNLDYNNYKHINNKNAHNTILDIKMQNNLIDPYREFHPKLRRYTWRKKNPIKQARLDFFLTSESLLPSISNCSIEGSYRSDHSIITLTCNFTKFTKGKPLWKHNNSLLQDIEYLNTMNEKITDVKKQYALPVYNLENIN
ncbi:MAG: endonuclease/exonuclease/phosphatase family protein, partial [Sedimenticola sp.]